MEKAIIRNRIGYVLNRGWHKFVVLTTPPCDNLPRYIQRTLTFADYVAQVREKKAYRAARGAEGREMEARLAANMIKK